MAAREEGSGEPGQSGLVLNGWTIFCHPLFLDGMERLTSAVERERASAPEDPPSANAKLLAHLSDLAFNKIPQDPGSPAFRHGGTLTGRRKWFRGRTGNGRYRLFYRFDSAARIIVYAWVNDENSLRSYGKKDDAYAVFGTMLDSGSPPDEWEALLRQAGTKDALARLTELGSRIHDPLRKPEKPLDARPSASSE